MAWYVNLTDQPLSFRLAYVQESGWRSGMSKERLALGRESIDWSHIWGLSKYSGMRQYSMKLLST